MPFPLRIALTVTILSGISMNGLGAQEARPGHSYTVDCDAATPDASHNPGDATSLHSLREVNALLLASGDRVLFRRGTVCRGSLHPRGSGFNIGAYGTGPLPVIEAGPNDNEALGLFNQERLSIESLDLRGGTNYGIHISGDKGTMHSIVLRNLTVSGVRGTLRRKASGLVVIAPASPNAGFDGVHLDGIRAFATTQWAGIFIAGSSPQNPARSVTVDHSLVHDVQGDGIVIFNGSESSIQRSVAWHTGMQHQYSIGTPNAIWTWHCDRCTVAGNEAFLTDSPGVDGGAFDIDWGNTANSVEGNFAHDTQGYCVAVFAANGPTKNSVVSHNLCLNNGLSPRLAQRQGAILLMTWNAGRIDGLTLEGNRVDWDTAGNTPVVQTGNGLQAGSVILRNNEFHTTGTSFLSSRLSFSGLSNQFFLEHATEANLAEAERHSAEDSAAGTKIALEPASIWLPAASSRTAGWRLEATLPRTLLNEKRDLTAVLLNLKMAALEYSHSGLRVSLAGDPDLLQVARDWNLDMEGVELKPLQAAQDQTFSLMLIGSDGRAASTWSDAAPVTELGLALRQALGRPDYGRLEMEDVPATN